jgi:hypothetical protein
MQIDIPIRVNLGAEPTVLDLREAMEKLRRVPDGAAVRFEISRGQRDSEVVTLLVQGAALLEP